MLAASIFNLMMSLGSTKEGHLAVGDKVEQETVVAFGNMQWGKE